MLYVFGDCTLDTQRYVLHRANQATSLRPKAFHVFLYLLMHRDRVITKQELAEQIWPDQFISDAVLENTIRAVRRALDDSAHTQRYIQTLRGYGYRFVAMVEERDETFTDDTSETELGFQSSASGSRQGARYALLIGNGHYPFDKHLADLPDRERDVEGLAAVLTEPEIAPFQVVQRLHNASHHEVRNTLLRLVQTAQKDDLVLLYFSGHVRLDDQGKFHLIVMDTQPDRLGDTALALDQIKDMIESCQSTRIILILDCCFSSVMGSPVALHILEDQMHWLACGRGKYILSSSPAPQAVQDQPPMPYRPFTPHLIEGLRTGNADIDRVGAITIDQLY